MKSIRKLGGLSRRGWYGKRATKKQLTVAAQRQLRRQLEREMVKLQKQMEQDRIEDAYLDSVVSE